MKRPVLLLFAAATLVASGAENLLRNGSFEGGLLYWHNIRPEVHALAKDEGKVGEYALRLSGHYIMSAPVVLERSRQYTISLWARGEQPGRVSIAMPPSAREIGQKSGRLWSKGAGKSADIGTDWTRVSVTFPADVPQTGFWRLPHYLIQISGGKNEVVYIDGVTVTEGTEGTQNYVPRRSVEVVADCENLPGYRNATGNTFSVGATAEMTAHVSNPGTEAREVTVRWQLLGYEGIAAVGPAVDRLIALEGGATYSETVPLKLEPKGCVVARLSVLGGDGRELDRSEFPLTTLPYPKQATAPDPRERFGGSFAGGAECLERMQRIGFGWTRWWPGNKWHAFEPEEGKYNWQDEKFEEAYSRGISCHVVLYGWPKWIMDKDHPLPRDMRWKADDPRWDDLTVETAWDRFVKAATEHFRGKPVVLQLANEPGNDQWKNGYIGEYVKFTMRTARLIKETDPQARVSLNNVYANPSRVNAALIKARGLKDIDIWSWHDYHAGRLLDANGMKRLRSMLDSADGEHLEIWFTEGWAFTNTRVDEPIACTSVSSTRSTNLIMTSVAEMAANGHDQMVLFHLMYGTHGMSFWDYSGPGTMLWDWYGYPLPLVAAWNVMTHHIGISEPAGFTRPLWANVCAFNDLRNGRGVLIAYADTDAKDDPVVQLPDVGANWLAEDVMANPVALDGSVTLSRTGRPVFLYTDANTDGKTLIDAFEPQDRRHASFVSGPSGQAWSLPPSWQGKENGSSEGSVAKTNGKPVWSLEQVWPPKPGDNANYRPMVWNGTVWHVAEGSFGGQPTASRDGRVMALKTRAPHGPANDRHRRACTLTFHVPADGSYALSGSVFSRIWDGKNKTVLRFYRRAADTVEELHSLTVPHQETQSLDGISLNLAAGDRLSIYPDIQGMFAGGQCELRDLEIRQAGGASAGSTTYRLPAAWPGTRKGSSEGNPIMADGEPVWRLDQVYPDKPLFTENYVPMPWNGTHWKANKHDHGGHPSAKIENGKLNMGAMGRWKNFEFQKIGALIFVAPKTGQYRVTGEASAHPWTGGAKHYTLSIRKKDTQRAPEVEQLKLPRDKTPVPFGFTIDLNQSHELAFVSLMPDWHNGCSFRINGLTIALTEAAAASPER